MVIINNSRIHEFLDYLDKIIRQYIFFNFAQKYICLNNECLYRDWLFSQIYILILFANIESAYTHIYFAKRKHISQFSCLDLLLMVVQAEIKI